MIIRRRFADIEFLKVKKKTNKQTDTQNKQTKTEQASLASFPWPKCTNNGTFLKLLWERNQELRDFYHIK